jgi:D-sedoheptulose 7-phosphate isomerase
MFKNYLQTLEQVLHSFECSEGRQSTDVTYLTNTIVSILIESKNNGKKLMWIGNGGSAAIASHGAIDYWRTGEIKSVCFNDGALLSCIGNDFGYAAVFQKPIEMFAEPGDVLVAISSSGQSENIINGVKAARKRGCKVIALSGFLPDNPLRMLGDLNFYVPSRHYGHVELAHGVLCHSFLDLYMDKLKGEPTW